MAHDFRFTDRRQASGITFENLVVDDAGKTYKLVHYDHGNGLCAADVDGDGGCGHDSRGKSSFIFGNELFANQRGGRFKEISDSVGVETYWPWGPSVDDFNADGWDDIFIAAGMNFPFRYGINSLLLNEAGHHFMASEFVLGVEPRPNGTTQVWFTSIATERARSILCVSRVPSRMPLDRRVRSTPYII